MCFIVAPPNSKGPILGTGVSWVVNIVVAVALKNRIKVYHGYQVKKTPTEIITARKVASILGTFVQGKRSVVTYIYITDHSILSILFSHYLF